MRRKVTIPLIFQLIYSFRLLMILIFSTAYCRLFFRFLGIHLQNGSKFYGVPFIYFCSGSKISMGKNIKFRTSQISNFIGLNHKTMISTNSQNAEIIIGDNCSFSAVVIGARESINIGNDVMVGANVLITDNDWHSMELNHEIPKSKPIIISDNVFIGYSSTILKGVSIGKNSIIGANSIVTKDIPANVVAAGNPCKIIRNIINT
jgi:acetyltransferase-like isoleucine patch superfamily enzyme